MARIIITERQLSEILLLECMARLLQESSDDDKFRKARSMVRKCIIAGVAAGGILAAINNSSLPDYQKDELSHMVVSDTTNAAPDGGARQDDSVFSKKVNACRDYMEYALRNQGYTLESTDLKPETLVRASMTHGFDLPFLMAAAHQESCFGATPRARRTNSVFSEGLYDNGHNAVVYTDPNESVYGYIDLLKNDYLRQGKTLSDLLIPGNFVNYNGHRYASDKNYERKISSIRNRIIQNYPNLS